MDTLLTRIARRETHSPRTVATVVVLVLVGGAALLAGVEIVLRSLGVGPMSVAPAAALEWMARSPFGRAQAAVMAGALATAALGVVFVWLALSPGRRARHELAHSSHLVVTDDEVIASAVAERVRRDLDLPRRGVSVGVGHRSVHATVRPEPGQMVDASQVRASVEAELVAYALAPHVRARVRVVRPAEGKDQR